MARRFKKFTLPKTFRLGNLIFAIVLIASIVGIFSWLRSFISDSEYFKIKKVDIVLTGRVPLTDDTVKDLLGAHRGRNIFDVDLRATKNYILSNYPEVRTIVINRAFPDKLILKIRPRRPIAQIALSSGFCLMDAEAIVLPLIRALVQPDLPIINGMDSRFVVARIGKRCDTPGIRRALWLIGVLNQSRFSEGHDVHIIDVSDEKNLSFYIEGGIEIRIGGEDFKARIDMLRKTFETGRLDKAQIKYIDLRFGNVIIGLR